MPFPALPGPTRAHVTGGHCRAVFGSLAGMETLTLETDALSVVILVGKGADILSIVDRASGVDPLLRAPWGVRDPRHGVPGDSSPWKGCSAIRVAGKSSCRTSVRVHARWDRAHDARRGGCDAVAGGGRRRG